MINLLAIWIRGIVMLRIVYPQKSRLSSFFEKYDNIKITQKLYFHIGVLKRRLSAVLIADKHLCHRIDGIAVLDYGRARHECGQVGTTYFTIAQKAL